ncbi:MAG: helix-turn-helix domain-containing protein [Thaumarchaeota archaeon]|nr:helix-turn-helix domain-containing protein [Nitrososphaerota archaeon]
MTVKKAIELLEQNNRHHLEDIKLYGEVLKKYEESNKARPPHHELAKQQQEIFLGLITMIKATKETQIKFNNGIINLLTKKVEMVVEDKVSFRRKQVKNLLQEGYKQKEIAQKLGCSLSTVEKDLRTIRKEFH